MEFTNHTSTTAPKEVIELLQVNLATCFDLYTQTKQAHWNCKGPAFYGIHKMFDDLSGHLIKHVDIIAERIGALGGYPMGYASSIATSSILDNPVDDLVQDLDWIAFILDQYHHFSKELYQSISAPSKLDPASEDLLIALVRDIDQGIYFLSAHLEDSSSDEVYETGSETIEEIDLENDEEVVDDGSDKVI